MMTKLWSTYASPAGCMRGRALPVLIDNFYMADMSNDCFADVIIGAWYFNNSKGRVYIFYGGPDMDENPDIVIDGETRKSQYDFEATVGDMNHDDFAKYDAPTQDAELLEALAQREQCAQLLQSPGCAGISYKSICRTSQRNTVPFIPCGSVICLLLCGRRTLTVTIRCEFDCADIQRAICFAGCLNLPFCICAVARADANLAGPVRRHRTDDEPADPVSKELSLVGIHRAAP